MSVEMTENSHPDSIWTWKSNARSRRASLWIPYFEGVEKLKGSNYRFLFKGGPIEFNLKEVDTILLYGAAGTMPVEFLDALSSQHVTLLVHRRNIPTPLVMLPLATTDQADILSRQILYREDRRRRLYIARTLIAARVASMRWLAPVPGARLVEVRRSKSLVSLRQVEAETTKAYWSRYYEKLGLADIGRRSPHPVNAALDACSFFLFGVMLRWVVFHRLSPAHGFMHQPTDYQSLVYDLMEPYRYTFEVAVHDVWLEDQNAETLTTRSLSRIKDVLGEDAYVGNARAAAKRKSLLHAVVLALRAYLLNEMPRLVVPAEGGSRGGRPPKLSFAVPGARTTIRKKIVVPADIIGRMDGKGEDAAF